MIPSQAEGGFISNPPSEQYLIPMNREAGLGARVFHGSWIGGKGTLDVWHKPRLVDL